MAANHESLNLPDCVLDFTEGKRAIMVGGQGAREEAREKLETVLGFHSLEWFCGEKHDYKHFYRAERLILGGGVDIVFSLTMFSSHEGELKIKKAAERSGTKFIRINGGYSPQRFSYDIQKQIPRNVVAHA